MDSNRGSVDLVPPRADIPAPEGIPVAPDGTTSSQTVTTSTGPTSALPSGNPQMALALITFVGFFAILTALLFVPVPATASSTLSIMLGALTAGVSTILGYYFGSSASSARKTELIHEGK